MLPNTKIAGFDGGISGDKAYWAWHCSCGDNNYGRVPEKIKQTCNTGEMYALASLLATHIQGSKDPHVVRGDSALAIGLVFSNWKARAPHLKHLQDYCRGALELCENVTGTWVPRAKNAIADKLVNEAKKLDKV